jgi:hypothetical protein
MKFSAPKQITWWVGLVLFVIALIGELGIIGAVEAYAGWFALAAAALMLLATAIEGL